VGPATSTAPAGDTNLIIATRFLEAAAYKMFMNINTSTKTANDLRQMLRLTDVTPGASHLFERDNGDFLLLLRRLTATPRTTATSPT